MASLVGLERGEIFFHRWLELSPVRKKSTTKTATRGSFWTLRTTQKVMWENQLGRDLAKRAQVDPKGVPWDQNFWSKIFLILPLYDVYLKDFLIY